MLEEVEEVLLLHKKKKLMGGIGRRSCCRIRSLWVEVEEEIFLLQRKKVHRKNEWEVVSIIIIILHSSPQAQGSCLATE